MQRKRRYGAVRVGILPASAAGGVVDRQQLDEGLSRRCRPVHQRPQVAEFADTEVFFGTQGKDRDRRSRSAPARLVKNGRRVLPVEGIARRNRYPAVGPLMY